VTIGIPVLKSEIMRRLKEETADCHARVDALMDLPLMSLARYGASLAALRDAHRAVEAGLQRQAESLAKLGYDPAARSKLEWLEADLTALGADAGSDSRFELRIPNTAAALGAVYVMEGSTLGGQVIARHAIASLGVTPDSGCRYFTGYGADTGPRWRETSAAITRYATASPGDADRMIAAANDTFALVESALRVRLTP
jgi:heme oxygenase